MKIISKFGGKYRRLVRITIALITATTFCFFWLKEKKTISYASISTQSSLSTDYPTLDNNLGIQSLPIEINAQENFKDYNVDFLIPSDTVINVSAVGEASSYSTNPYLFKSYDNDGVEIYFDMNNEKAPLFDVHKDDRQYRVLWKTLKIDGQNINKNGMAVRELDITQNKYIMEIAFPWKSLGFVSPKVNLKFGFDISLIDSDGGTMKAELNWNSKSEDSWRNTSYYGNIVLVNNVSYKADSGIVYSTKRISKSYALNKITQGIKERPNYIFSNVTIGYVVDSLDLSGSFRSEWDMENLYLTVFVRDNIKSEAKALFDYGWIEDSNGHKVWTMTTDHLSWAGGAVKNQRTDTTLRIKKGKYRLRYHTDESHSPSQWDDLPPNYPFYGIKITNKKLL